MTRTLATAAALAVGCSTPVLEGKLVDAMTGEPITGVDIVMQANKEESPSLTCMTKGSPVADDGTFKVELCPNGYSFAISDENLWAADFPGVEAAGPPAGVTEIKVWRAPSGLGLYPLSQGTLGTPLKTGMDLSYELALNDRNEKIYYPAGVKNVGKIGPDDHLVMVGTANVDDQGFYPMYKSDGPRKFAGKTEDHAPNSFPDPWWFIGVEFQTDTEWTRHTAQLDESKIIKKRQGDRVAWIVPAAALPPGRYAFTRHKDPKRAYAIDWGGYTPPE